MAVAALLLLATVAAGIWNSPPPVALIAVGTSAAAALVIRRRTAASRAARWTAPTIAVGAVGAVLVFASWRDPGVLSAFLLIAGWTKLAEARSPRDDLPLVLAGLWPLTLAALAAPPGAGAAVLAVGGALALRRLAGPSARPFALLRAVALALPAAAVVFVFTPRITGNLNVLAFALGIPLVIETADERARVPLEDGLELGDLSSRADTDSRVLVAKFYGGAGNIFDGVPPLGDLYWRGPALYHHEAGVWRGRPGWENRSTRMRSKLSRAAMKADMRETGKLSAYDVRVFPHRGHALYSLDLPAAVPPSSFITRDYQLQNLNPLREILVYPMYSFLDYRAGQTLDDDDRALALQWAEGENPRTLDAGRALRAAATDDVALARAVRDRFAQGYRYDKRARGYEGPDPVDAFLFDRREGYASHYATAAVMLLRAAGLPARLIVGYRGGVNLGLTQMVYVMETDAYAWAEVWLEDRGW
ncbi:MAG: transglutaminaseTgpA domain-containing protein, partial [Pseudomonadota bacterium]